MRSFFFIFVTFSFLQVTVLGQDAKPKNTIEENVLTLLTKWRTGDMKNFLFPLPSLDRIMFSPVKGSYDGYGARISYSTNNLTLTGLNQFVVEQLDIAESTLNASAQLSVPQLTLSSDRYNINGRALIIPVSGSGNNMTIIFRRIRLNISIRLRTNTTNMWVDDLLLSFRVGSVASYLDGGPSSIVVILNSSGASIIQSYHDDIVRSVKGLAMPAIDKFLAGNSIATPRQLIQLAQDVQGAPSVTSV